MATITGINAGTTVITASYNGKSSQVTLIVTKDTPVITYNPVAAYPKKTGGASATTLYCTYAAEAKTSTVAAYNVGLTNLPTSTSGLTCTCSVKSVTKSGTSVSGWSILSDKKTLSVPASTTNGTYSVVITATDPGNSNWNTTSVDKTITITVTSTSISTYGTVSNPSVTDTASAHDVPASAITISTSNIGTYVTVGTSSQTITYNNGATRNGSISYAWSGTSTDLASLGTTSASQAQATINTMTYTATGEGSKTGSASIDKLWRQANTAGSWSASFTVQPTWNDITAAGAAGAPNTKGTAKVQRTWTSGSVEQHTSSPGATTYGSWSYSAGAAASAPNGFSINSSTGNCTATSLGTTSATRTQRGNAKLTFTANSSYGGSSVTATSNSVAVYQAANTAGAWSASFTTQPTWNDITAAGAAGSRNAVGVVKVQRTWTSTSVESYNTSPDSTTYGSWSYSKTDGSSPNGFAINSSTGACTATSLGTTSASRTKRGSAKVTFTASSSYGSVTAASNNVDVYQGANSEITTTHYKNTSGTTGDNWTYGTPVALTTTNEANMTLHGGSLTLVSSVTDTKQYYLKWTSGSYLTHTENPSGTVAYKFTNCSTNSGSNDFTITDSTLSHRDMGTGGFSGTGNGTVTDTCTVVPYNANDTSKVGTGKTWNLANNRTKVMDGYKSYGTPTISIGTGFTAAGGSAVITCGCGNNVRYYHYTYTDSTHNESANAHEETEAATSRWRITSQFIGTANNSSTGTTITRFSHPSSGSSNLTIGGTATATYATGTSVSHSSMTTNVGFDGLVVTAYNILDTTKTASANLHGSSKNVQNALTWANPVITKANASTTVTSGAATVSLAADGKTSFTFAPTITQSGSYTSGSTTSNTTATYTYAETTAKTGYSLSSSTVSVTNNTSTSARNGYVVTITATGSGSKTATAAITFNQPAGAQVYETPVIGAYSYADFAASGTSKTPTVTYSQVWTWNSVTGSGGTLTSGGTLAYSTTGTLPIGFTTNSDFATTGAVTWANRATTTGNARDAKSNLKVTVTMNGKTSSAYTCTKCNQVANVLTWNAPSITQTTSISLNKAGETYTFNPTLAQSGTYTSGSTATNTVTYKVEQKIAATGYSINTTAKTVTVTNNTSTSARNGYVVTITASANKKNSSDANETGTMSNTKDVTFNQPAGGKVYDTPTVTGFSYDDFAAAGATKTPTVTFSQVWTWNGVAGSGGTLTSDSSLSKSFTTTGTLPSGFTTGSDFATTGSVTWANRTTVEGAARDAKSNLKVTVTVNSKTSSAYTCTKCNQVKNEVTSLVLTLNSHATLSNGDSHSSDKHYDLTYNKDATTTVEATYTSGSKNTNFTGASITSSKTDVATVS